LNKKGLALFLCLALGSTLVAGCGGGSGDAGAKAKEIKIGTILQLSGSAAPLGKIGQQARDMAIEEINSSGGIKSMDGAQISMVYADSKGDPATGVSEAERLISQEGVVMITGQQRRAAVDIQRLVVDQLLGFPAKQFCRLAKRVRLVALA
jgi:branched-chain amino acid transport system substrate-binding protein